MPKNRFGRLAYALLVLILLGIIGRNAYRRVLNNRLINAVQAKSVAAVGDLLARGADPNSRRRISYGPESGTPVLTMAINSAYSSSDAAEVACLLIQHGAIANLEPKNTNNDLLLACRCGSPMLTRCLLEHGANANGGDERGGSNPVEAAIQYAASFSTPHTSPIEGSEAQRMQVEADKKQHRAISQELVRLLKEHGARLTLRQAIRVDDVDTLRALLDAGTPIESREPSTMSVTVAGKPHAVNGPTALAVAAQAGSLRAARLLLERGANINPPDGDFSSSPLNSAIVEGHLEMARLLLQRGSAVNGSGNGVARAYSTPLALSCTSLPELVPELLDRVADVKTTGGYAVGAAISGRHPELLALLWKRGASVRGKPGYSALSAAIQYRPELVPQFLAQGADAHDPAGAVNGLIPLAVRHGRASLIEPLLRAGAKMNTGVTIVTYTTSMGSMGSMERNSTSFSLLMDALGQGTEMVRVLLEHGVDPNISNTQGETPLISVAQSGNAEVARLLLAHKAAVDKEGGVGHTPLYYAHRHKHPDVAALLQQAGGHDR